MNLESQLIADVYTSQCELARMRGEEPLELTQAFKDWVMDVFLDPGYKPADENEAFFVNMVRRFSS